MHQPSAAIRADTLTNHEPEEPAAAVGITKHGTGKDLTDYGELVKVGKDEQVQWMKAPATGLTT